MYLASPGRPTDTGLQLGKAAILAAGKGRGGMFLFLLFFFFTFIHVPLSPHPSLSSPLLSLLFLSSLSLGDDTK